MGHVPRNAALPVRGVSPAALRAVERPREPAAIREVQQSLWARPQLRSGSARGPLDASGRAVDAERLDELVKRQVLEPFGHRNLNADVDSFERVVPTSENLAVEICRRLKENWSGAFPGEWPKLDRVRIAETARNIFEVRAV